MENRKPTEEKSIYTETYNWISCSLKEGPEASLTAIASTLSSAIHGVYGKLSPDITDVLCGIRNAIWEWEGNLYDHKRGDN